MNRIKLLSSGSVALAIATIGYGAAATDRPAPVPAIEQGSVRSIRLPEAIPALPDAPGKEAVQVHCGVCHTTEYITLQPPFPRETWISEVKKMRTTFNGPIPEEKVDEIVDYLVAVRGAAAK